MGTKDRRAQPKWAPAWQPNYADLVNCVEQSSYNGAPYKLKHTSRHLSIMVLVAYFTFLADVVEGS
jgi:hypothetical protein